MNTSPGQRKFGWQVLAEPRSRVPQPGDVILTLLDGSLLQGIVERIEEPFEGRAVVVAEIAIGIPGSTVRRRLIEALDDSPTEGTWRFRPDDFQSVE